MQYSIKKIIVINFDFLVTLTLFSGNFLATNVIITRCHKSFEKTKLLSLPKMGLRTCKKKATKQKQQQMHIKSISVSHQFLFVLVRCHYKVAGKTPGSCLYRYQDQQCAQGLCIRQSRLFPTHTQSVRDRTEGTPMTPGSHCPHPTLCVHSRPLKNIQKWSSTLQSSDSKVLWYIHHALDLKMVFQGNSKNTMVYQWYIQYTKNQDNNMKLLSNLII